MKESSQNPSFGQGLELANIVNKAIAYAVKEKKVNSSEIQKVIGKPGKVFDLVNKLFSEVPVNENVVVSSFSFKEKLVLEALQAGYTTISKAKNTFYSYLDPNFKKWDLDNNQRETGETVINIYEITKNVNYSQMFTFFNSDLDKMCLTQSQIIRFCEKYPSYLRQDGFATLFLFKENNEYFFALVRVFPAGLSVLVSRFVDDHFWGAKFHHHVVVPKLID